jgi:hypothetical protein
MQKNPNFLNNRMCMEVSMSLINVVYWNLFAIKYRLGVFQALC